MGASGENYIKYLASLLIFGTIGIVASFIELDSFRTVLVRLFVGTLTLGAVLVFRRKKPDVSAVRRNFPYLFLSSLGLTLGWTCIFEAYRESGVAVPTVIYYCGPTAVMLLSPFLFREKLTAGKLLGFFSAVFGMVLLNVQEFSAGADLSGIGFALLAAAFYACMIIFGKKIEGMDGVEMTFSQLLISLFLFTLYSAVFRGEIFFAVPRESVVPLLFLGMFNTGLGCFLYFSAIGKLPAQKISVLSYLDPLSAILFSAVILEERLTALQGAGCAFIIGGAVLSELLCIWKRSPRGKAHRMQKLRQSGSF